MNQFNECRTGVLRQTCPAGGGGAFERAPNSANRRRKQKIVLEALKNDSKTTRHFLVQVKIMASRTQKRRLASDQTSQSPSSTLGIIPRTVIAGDSFDSYSFRNHLTIDYTTLSGCYVLLKKKYSPTPLIFRLVIAFRNVIIHVRAKAHSANLRNRQHLYGRMNVKC